MKIKQLVLVLAMVAANCMAGDIEDFTGGVYRSRGVVISDTMVMTPDGPIYKVGDNYITPNGFYSSNQGCYVGGGQGAVTQNGQFFYGGGKLTVGAGGSYVTDGHINYVAGSSSGVSSTMRKP